MGVVRALMGLVRLAVMAVLVAAVLLAGIGYLDSEGRFAPRLRAAAETVVSPEVVAAVEEGGSTVAGGLADLLAELLTRVDGAVRGTTGGEAGNTSTVRDDETVQETRAVLDAINAYRAAHDLEPLAWNDRLADFAQVRADDMIERDYFSHHDPQTGEVLLAGLRSFVTVGENLYQISGGTAPLIRHVADKVVEGWRSSPSHNELMLDAQMRRAGIGLARGGPRIVVVLVASE
jgi:uncharacterized protein YkwD